MSAVDDRGWEQVGFLRAALELLANGDDTVSAARWLELYEETYPAVPHELRRARVLESA